jgi:putative aldouronate transport system permease protein
MMANVDQVQAQQGLRELLKYSLIVVASAPVLIIYPFVQRHFVKGVMIGSLKG